jgi:hypothetical protein
MVNHEVASPEQLVGLGERERQRQPPQRFFRGGPDNWWAILDVSDNESGGSRRSNARQRSHRLVFTCSAISSS